MKRGALRGQIPAGEEDGLGSKVTAWLRDGEAALHEPGSLEQPSQGCASAADAFEIRGFDFTGKPAIT